MITLNFKRKMPHYNIIYSIISILYSTWYILDIQKYLPYWWIKKIKPFLYCNNKKIYSFSNLTFPHYVTLVFLSREQVLWCMCVIFLIWEHISCLMFLTSYLLFPPTAIWFSVLYSTKIYWKRCKIIFQWQHPWES